MIQLARPSIVPSPATVTLWTEESIFFAATTRLTEVRTAGSTTMIGPGSRVTSQHVICGAETVVRRDGSLIEARRGRCRVGKPNPPSRLSYQDPIWLKDIHPVIASERRGDPLEKPLQSIAITRHADEENHGNGKRVWINRNGPQRLTIRHYRQASLFVGLRHQG